MSSIAYPVMSDGKLIGVGGVDISLASLAENLSKLRPFGTGRVMLVSQDFKWLVGPDASSMMKDYDGDSAETVKAALSTATGSTIGDVTDAEG